MKIYRIKLMYPVGLSDDKLIEFLRQLNLPWHTCCVHAECYCGMMTVRRHGRFAYYGTVKYVRIPSFENMYARNLTRTTVQFMYFDEFHGRWARLEIYPAHTPIVPNVYTYIGEI